MQWCVEKKQELVDKKKTRESDPNSPFCECTWKKLICCEVFKENYHNYMEKKMKSRAEARQEEMMKKDEG